MSDGNGTLDPQVISYQALRKVIGIVGMALPFLLPIGGALFFQERLLASMSDYYHTGMVGVFVGVLSAIGFFLFSYMGYDRRDYIAGRLASLFAVGVALFPNNPPNGDNGWVSVVHFTCAFGFFATLIYFCLWLFPLGDKKHKPTNQKLRRNKVYRACGYIMIACIGLLMAYFGYGYFFAEGADSPLERYSPVFWLEAAMVVAFAVSWLVKGEAVLADPPEPPPQP